jgi:hypothetical protein
MREENTEEKKVIQSASHVSGTKTAVCRLEDTLIT